VMRLRLAETPAFQQQRASCPRTPLPRAFWANRTPCLRVILLTVGPTVFYYSWVVAAPTQAISVRGVDPTTALWVGVLANAVFILVLPLFGILSDRVGRKPVLIGSYLGTAVLTFPLSWLLRNEAWQLAVAMIVAMLFTAGTAAIGPAVFAELFPIGLRTAGVGLPYAVGVAACGGTAPYLQTWLATHGLGNLFFGYTVVLLLVGLVVVWRMRETKDVDLASR